jgi:glycerol-3-phosphate acyltransferase PlsY
MLTLLVVVCTVLAYLLGSIPTAIWYGEAYFGIDVRKHGAVMLALLILLGVRQKSRNCRVVD